MIRNVVQFPASSEPFVTFPNNSAWQGFLDGFTFEALVKRTHKDKRETLASMYDTVGNQRSWFIEFLTIDSDQNVIQVVASTNGINNGSQYWIGAAPNDEWFRLSLRLNDTTEDFELLINGADQGAPLKTVVGVTSFPSTGTSNSPLVFGKSQYATGRDFEGLISDARLWNFTRTNQAISSDRYLTLAGNESGLVFYAPMDEGSGNVINIAATGGEGVLTDGATWNTSELPEEATSPILSDPTGSSNGANGYAGTVSTDKAAGSLFHAVTTSPNSPTGVQIKAGTDHSNVAALDSGSQSVDSVGSKSVSGSGLSEGETYYLHFYHETTDNESLVASSNGFVVVATSSGTPPTPINLSVSNITGNSATLSWSQGV